MSKLDAIRTLLQKALLAFERISTDKALIEFDGDTLEVGMAVHGINEDGESFDLEDGEYTADDNTVYVVKGGKVEEIREPEGITEDETTGDDVEPEAEQESEAETEPESEEPTATDEPEGETPEEHIANLEQEIARLEEENAMLKERIKELEEKPATEPASEEFEKVNKIESTGNKRMDNLKRILNA